MNYECVEVPFLHSNLGLLTLDIFFNRKVLKDLRKGRKAFFLPRTCLPACRLHELSRIFMIYYLFVYYLLSSFLTAKYAKIYARNAKVFLPRTCLPAGRLHGLSRIFKIFYRFVYYLLSSFHIFIKNKSLMLLLHKIT